MTPSSYFRRYRWIFLLLAVLLVFGTKVLPPSPISVDKNQYQLNQEDQQAELFSRYPTIAGQHYRMTFALRVAPSSVLLDPGSQSEAGYRVRRTAAFVESEVLHEGKIKDIQQWQYFSIEFIGLGGEETLYVEKNQAASLLLMSVRPLTLFAINQQALGEQVAFGSGSLEEMGNISPNNEGLSYQKLGGVKRVLAQRLSFSVTNIAAVEISLRSKGYGGNGDYALALYELDQEGGQLRASKLLASQSFNISSLREFSLGKDRYLFPLPAKVVPERDFLLALDAHAVVSSPFHYLSVGVVPNDKTETYRLKTLGDSLSTGEDVGFALRAYTKKASQLGDETLLEGQVIQSRGSHRHMSYVLSHQPDNTLDIESYEGGGDVSSVPRFSVAEGATVMEASSAASYRYKIPLGGNLMRAEVVHRTTSPASPDISLAYSLDGKSWQTLTADAWSTSSLIRNTIEGRGSVLWLEVRYRPSTSSPAKFGLETLRVSAEVESR